MSNVHEQEMILCSANYAAVDIVTTMIKRANIHVDSQTGFSFELYFLHLGDDRLS